MSHNYRLALFTFPLLCPSSSKLSSFIVITRPRLCPAKIVGVGGRDRGCGIFFNLLRPASSSTSPSSLRFCSSPSSFLSFLPCFLRRVPDHRRSFAWGYYYGLLETEIPLLLKTSSTTARMYLDLRKRFKLTICS